MAKRYRFLNQTAEEYAIRLAAHTQAVDKSRNNLHGGAGEEGLGEMLRESGSYGDGYVLKVIQTMK